jgi:hypothetical protein
MGDGNATSLVDAFGQWHEFYALLGSASATLIGLLFVAATVGSGAFTPSRRAAQRVFLSASVVHFGSVLAVCLIILLPLRRWLTLGIMILGCGLFGLGYFGLTWRDTIRDGLSARIDLEDRIWYLVLPATGYLIEAGAGIALALRQGIIGSALLAASAAWLLIVGIHNAWDITIWSVTRTRD